MKRQALILILASGSCFGANEPAALPHGPTEARVPESHCAATETVYYNCRIDGLAKVASVCGDRLDLADQTAGHLQYRFGLIGAIEFRFPADPQSARTQFHFEQQRTRDGSTQDYFLWFRNNTWIYQIDYRDEFECTETGCAAGPAAQAAYVSVWNGLAAWRSGDETQGRNFRCLNPEANTSLKSLESAGLNRREVRASIFAADTR